MEEHVQHLQTSPSARREARLPEDDRLKHAFCPKCDYHLRGLTQNRCPECGSTFDPDELLKSFSPLWPRLMTWWLAAGIVGALLGLPYAVEILVNFFTGKPGYPASITWFRVTWLTVWTLTVFPGAAAATGLHRGQDWGRRVAIALYILLTALYPLAFAICLAFHLLTLTFFQNASWLIPYFVSNLFAVTLPSLLILIFLTSGLRRHSLTGKGNDTRPRLSLEQFHPRGDWLLLISVLLIGLGLQGLLNLIYYLPMVASPGLWPGPATKWPFALALVLVQILTILFCIIATVRIRRQPRRVRRSTIILLALMVISSALAMTVSTLMMSGTAMGNEPLEIAKRIMPAVGALLPPLALVLFAFFTIDHDAVRLAGRPKR